MLGIHELQTKQANKQNNRKTHHPDEVGLGLGGEMRMALVCSLGQFYFTVMAEKASQNTTTHTCV